MLTYTEPDSASACLTTGNPLKMSGFGKDHIINKYNFTKDNDFLVKVDRLLLLLVLIFRRRMVETIFFFKPNRYTIIVKIGFRLESSFNDLPARTMPWNKHFWKRQYWQRFL